MEESEHRRSILRRLFLYAGLLVLLWFVWFAVEDWLHISGAANQLTFLAFVVFWLSVFIVPSLIRLRRLSSSERRLR